MKISFLMLVALFFSRLGIGQCVAPISHYEVGTIPAFAKVHVIVQNLEPDTRCIDVYLIDSIKAHRKTVNLGAYRRSKQITLWSPFVETKAIVIAFHGRGIGSAYFIVGRHEYSLTRFDPFDLDLDAWLSTLPGGIRSLSTIRYPRRRGHRR